MDIVERYLGEMELAIRALSRNDVRRAVDALFAAWSAGRRVWILGNGRSAANASHIMADLCRCTQIPGAPRLRAMALSDNVPMMTAVANDTEYAEIFVEALRTHLDRGDVVLALSGSGNSPNVLRAVAYAKENGAAAIAFCGMPGGRLAKLADVRVIVPAPRIGQQEDGHLILGHVVSLALRERIEAVAGETASVSAVAG